MGSNPTDFVSKYVRRCSQTALAEIPLPERKETIAKMLKFTVLPPNSSVHLGDQEFVAGDNEVEEPSAELVKLAGSADAAGTIEVTEGLDDSHVESQEESEAKLAEAMGEWVEPERQKDGTTKPGYWTGDWYEGHVGQTAADADADRDSVEIADVDVALASEVFGKDA